VFLYADHIVTVSWMFAGGTEVLQKKLLLTAFKQPLLLSVSAILANVYPIMAGVFLPFAMI
jgi:hypothetical protein